MTKILINAGSSGFGWSYIEKFLRCPQMFFWHEKFGHLKTKEEPLVRGSIGHVGLAHLYAMLREIQQGRDPSVYEPPARAMDLASRESGQVGAEQLAVVTPVIQRYAQRYADDGKAFKIVDVERYVEIVFGTHKYTARIDLELQDSGGKIWIVDHKIVARIETKVMRRYVLSGQFLGLIHIGRRDYGNRFGGIRLNLIGVQDGKFERVTPDPAPWLLARFPSVVARAWEGIERCRAELARDPNWIIPATPSEHTCFPYNRPCPFWDQCRWGAENE